MERKFQRDLASLDKLFDFVSIFVEQQGIEEEAALTIKVAVEEIFTNLVKYDPLADAEIPVRLDRDGNRICIELINHNGTPFDVTEVRNIDVDAPPRKRRLGGLGLNLVRQIVDGFYYEYTDGTGIIKMVKNLEDNIA